MEITTVSSEDLSSYSFIHDSPSRNDTRNPSKNTVGPRRSRLSNINSQESCRHKSLKKTFRRPSEASAKNVKSSLNLTEKRKPPAKSNIKEVAKKNLTISTEKVKLTDRPLIRAGSSSINSAALKNPTSCKEKELRRFPTPHKKNKPGNVPPSRGTQAMRGCSKRNTDVEIEVFMPIIDVENNTITYPECRKPIMKVVSVKSSVTKSREDKRGNNYLNKKNKEGTVTSFSYSKAEREVNSSKKVSNSLRKEDVKNTVKTSLERNVSSVKDVKNSAAMDVSNSKTTYIRRSSIREANTVVDNLKNIHKFPIDSKTASTTAAETDSQKHKITQKFLRLLKDIAFDKENVLTLKREVIQEQSTNFTPPTDDERLKISTRRNSSEEPKEVTCVRDKWLWRKISRMPSPISCDSEEDDDVDLHPRTFVVVDHLSQSDDELDELDELDEESHSQQTWKQNTRCHQKYPKPRNWRKYKRLYADRISLERKESSFSSPGSLIKIDSNENSWRRTIPNNSFSSECFPTKSKWRRNIKDDGLTMDSWIERCKYLQAKQQYFQLRSQANKWRPS